MKDHKIRPVFSEDECPGECRYLSEYQREVSLDTKIVITGLKPYTRYMFAVQAYNGRGAGTLSHPVFARTLEDGE